MSFDWSTHDRRAPGSDNWAITWADDGQQYTSCGDGWGFSKAGRKKVSALRKVSATRPKLTAASIFGFEVESQSGSFPLKATCICGLPLEAPQTHLRNRGSISLMTTALAGLSGLDFQFNAGFFKPTFLQFGKDYTGARDGYVYSYAPERTISGFKSPEKLLLRVPKTNHGAHLI